ncbi:olfactory receptor 11L1-like [Hyperolius riggenbachi]|uniref:olfactory receptor 11L1-like n=1 Tax=Hyperolius riggenbachi TaxID=752182 RepID=UPI0035A2F0FD
MLGGNLTVITEIVLLGFQVGFLFQMVLFTVFLLIYCMTMFGNLLIITLVSYSQNLHTPMYFFLTQLSITDITLSSDIVPNMLHIFLNSTGTMSFSSCMSQFFFFTMTEIYECFLLTVMSYDRYVAVCNPLHYNSTMKQVFCLQLALLSLSLSILASSVEFITVSNLSFCGPNIIDHIYCDVEPLLSLSCSDAAIVHLEIIVLSIPVVVLPFILIILSYVHIIRSILRISSAIDRQKAFSTCSSHLAVVSLFYSIPVFSYVLPTKRLSWTLSKVLSLLYTVITPLVNPMIYSLRNKDIKSAFRKSVQSFCLMYFT